MQNKASQTLRKDTKVLELAKIRIEDWLKVSGRY